MFRVSGHWKERGDGGGGGYLCRGSGRSGKWQRVKRGEEEGGEQATENGFVSVEIQCKLWPFERSEGGGICTLN